MNHFKFLAIVVCSVVLSNCSRPPTHSVTDIATAWATVCVGTGVTAEKVEAIANTYSLTPFTNAELQKRKDDSARANILNPATQTFTKDYRAWWIDRDKTQSLYFASFVRILRIQDGSTKSAEASGCYVAGGPVTFEALAKSLETIPNQFTFAIPKNHDGSTFIADGKNPSSGTVEGISVWSLDPALATANKATRQLSLQWDGSQSGKVMSVNFGELHSQIKDPIRFLLKAYSEQKPMG